MSILKKTKKLFKDPKLFFKDAIEKKVFWLSGIYNKYLPKKYKGFTQYTIISAVYNVEKYLDDYFNSIINQRLDFKKNIFMILVDDGSTDDSANIIKKYQKKYPKNIVYLYKENGGQASARNLGLKYMQENNYKTPWVTFTDPDDFLDRNYFYEVDKFLSTHQDDGICMIGCKVLLFLEESKKILEHPLNILKSKKNNAMFVFELNNEIQTASRTLFLYGTIQKYQIYFDEKINIFEDVKFVITYLINLKIFNKIKFLPEANYYLRKRIAQNSTMDNALNNIHFYNEVLSHGVLGILKIKNNNIFLDKYIQNMAFSQLFYHIKVILNNQYNTSFFNKEHFFKIITKCFSCIDNDTILNFNALGNNFFHKVGILNCFKNEKPPFQIAYIEDYDPYKEQILITYYTGNDKDIESILVDEEEVYVDYKKIVKYDFLDRVFCYQKRLWVHIPKNAKDRLEVLINNEQAMINWQNYSIEINAIREKFNQLKKNICDIWLLMDRDIEADDNAEHLYRYIMQNHPEKKIIFALSKESPDWKRLEKEGFNLVECYSKAFFDISSKVKFFISSHTPASFKVRLNSGQKFLFLGHGVDAVDISKWFNSLNINVRFLSSTQEYDSIAGDYNSYALSKKEVVITGQPRHDKLLKYNRFNNQTILIMPTWRLYLVKNRVLTFDRELVDNFLESEYYRKWFSFINSSEFKDLIEKYKYNVNFVPHFNMRDIINKCNFPNYINVSYRINNNSLQKIFQNCDLMITDYTSASFEVGYLKKPVIYYQFDREYFFNNHSYKQGWFDYEKYGFGPVVFSEQKLIEKLQYYLKNGMCLEEKYLKNIDNIFKFRDLKCCERVFKYIDNLNLD